MVWFCCACFCCHQLEPHRVALVWAQQSLGGSHGRRRRAADLKQDRRDHPANKWPDMAERDIKFRTWRCEYKLASRDTATLWTDKARRCADVKMCKQSGDSPRGDGPDDVDALWRLSDRRPRDRELGTARGTCSAARPLDNTSAAAAREHETPRHVRENVNLMKWHCVATGAPS